MAHRDRHNFLPEIDQLPFPFLSSFGTQTGSGGDSSAMQVPILMMIGGPIMDQRRGRRKENTRPRVPQGNVGLLRYEKDPQP